MKNYKLTNSTNNKLMIDVILKLKNGNLDISNVI
jgi:hypothetical protein